jgi:hypothetical protein
MIFENVPIYEIIGIAVSEGISMVLALYILIVKLLNLRTAKSLHLTEGEWYRQYTHKKEIKKHLKSLGVHSLKDIAKYNEQQDHLHKVLDLLFEAYPDVVDNRILKFKIFRKTLKRHITNNAKRLEHFKNIASNADLASIIRLVYLDI